MNHHEVSAQWVNLFDEDTSDGIISLVDYAVRDGGMLGYAAPLQPEEAQEFLDKLQQRVWAGDAHVLLAHAALSPVMMVVLAVNGMHNCRHRAEISKGIVHPDFRGGRLVQLGMHRLVEKAELLGIEQFVLDVREGSRAHALWTNLGFCTYGVLDDYARIGNSRCRGHFMSQDVSSMRARISRNPAFNVQQNQPQKVQS